MEGHAGTVVLMCGLPGSGKSTYALGLVRAGYGRLSLDEEIWQRLGHRDAGQVLDQPDFDALKEDVRRSQRLHLIELMLKGRDVVVDYTFWSRAARADYRALIVQYGFECTLVYMRADHETLRARLAARATEADANSVTVSAQLLADYVAKFQVPHDEGEHIIDTSGAGQMPGTFSRGAWTSYRSRPARE